MKKFHSFLLILLALAMALSACTPKVPVTTEGTSPSSSATTETTSHLLDYDSMTVSELLGREESLTWVFTGDSITHNGSWTQGMNGYPEWFEQLLYDLGRDGDSVVATAWGGADIQDFLYASDTPTGNGMRSDPGMGIEQFITKYNPDVVSILLGTNNRGMSDEEFRSYYELMLQSIYAEGEKNGKIPKIIILTPPPLSGETIYNTEQTDYDSTWRFQKLLKDVAEDYDLTFVDLQTAFTQEALTLGADYNRTFFSDPSDGGLHPNAAGHYLMFNTLCKALGLYDEDMPIFQLEYKDFLDAALYADDTAVSSYSDEITGQKWTNAVQSNYLWAVVGGPQMSGYQGTTVNRSLFRLLDNGVRGGANNIASCRDIRLLNLSSPDYTMEYVAENYDAILGEHQDIYDVLFLLPEVSQVYEEGYVHSASLVAQYKEDVESILSKNNDKVIVLWTPLASGDDTLNAYLSDYADAIREIAQADSSILFFDANTFMNNRMEQSPSLKNNWFEEGCNITPLCATDVAYGFYIQSFLSDINKAELSDHNLRLTSDVRTFKGPYVRDNIAAQVTVSGTAVTLDASAILEKYPGISDLRVAVLPYVGAGNYHEGIWTIAAFDGSVCSFEAPYSNPVITVYGELDGYTYRFKDQTLAVATAASLSKPAAESETLTGLTVVGAPEFRFDPDTLSYDITLYQYQRSVQILATAGDNLTITVDGQEVASGEYSQQIAVEDTAAVTVKAGSKTYTLNLTRPESPDIIITEVMTDGYLDYDQAGGDNYDLIEIYNASGRDLNLLDYSIGYKKDYPYCLESATKGSWPYYFTGNDQAFQSTSSSAATYTGINAITKYSSYWPGGSYEPAQVLFPADSTMVIWVKYTPAKADASYSSALTYDTLIAALKAHAGTHTLAVNGQAVVPQQSQLVVAEIPAGETAGSLTGRSGSTAENAQSHFYLENHGTLAEEASTRSWLFILKDTAQMASNGAITEAGNDIVSAARFIRLAAADKLSTVFSYDADRGMALVKDLTVYDEDYTTGHLTSQQGYSCLTTFGAIEYWQKPADAADTTAPTVSDTSQGGSIYLTLTDDTDVRYLELYTKAEGETEFTKVTRDFVLEAGMQNAGLSGDTLSVTVTLSAGSKTQYYGFVVDGNGNRTAIGSETAPLMAN